MNRMRCLMIDAIKNKLLSPQMSFELDYLISIFFMLLNEGDKAIAKRLFDKINSKRGDTGHDSFWDYCKTSAKYRT